MLRHGEGIKRLNEGNVTWNSGAQSAGQLIALTTFVQLATERAFRGNCRIWGISENALQFAVRPAAIFAVKHSRGGDPSQ